MRPSPRLLLFGFGFRFVLVLGVGREEIFTVGAGLWAWDDAGDVGIFTVGGAGNLGLPALGFFAAPGLFLLAFLLGALSRSFLLSYLGSVRHRQVLSAPATARGQLVVLGVLAVSAPKGAKSFPVDPAPISAQDAVPAYHGDLTAELS